MDLHLPKNTKAQLFINKKWINSSLNCEEYSNSNQEPNIMFHGSQ